MMHKCPSINRKWQIEAVRSAPKSSEESSGSVRRLGVAKAREEILELLFDHMRGTIRPGLRGSGEGTTRATLERLLEFPHSERDRELTCEHDLSFGLQPKQVWSGWPTDAGRDSIV